MWQVLLEEQERGGGGIEEENVSTGELNHSVSEAYPGVGNMANGCGLTKASVT